MSERYQCTGSNVLIFYSNALAQGLGIHNLKRTVEFICFSVRSRVVLVHSISLRKFSDKGKSSRFAVS